jgi:hypothetical protein
MHISCQMKAPGRHEGLWFGLGRVCSFLKQRPFDFGRDMDTCVNIKDKRRKRGQTNLSDHALDFDIFFWIRMFSDDR